MQKYNTHMMEVLQKCYKNVTSLLSSIKVVKENAAY